MEDINIGGNLYRVRVVTSDEDMTRGLSDTSELPRGEGMLFDFKESKDITMNMYDMKYPLDMIFVDSDDKVIKTVTMEPGQNEVSVKDVRYVVEVNKGEAVGEVSSKDVLSEEPAEDVDEEVLESSSKNMIVSSNNISGNIKEKFQAGGSFKLYEEEVKALPGTMQVLDDTGKVLMNIKGGERIFSIKHTETLIDTARKVKAGDVEPEELGKLMKEYIHIQNTQEPEYVN